MSTLHELSVGCPYCGEQIGIVVDGSVPEQQYVEDCSVCCRPIELQVDAGSSESPRVVALRDDD